VANIHLNALLQFAETHDCRRIPLLNYFGEAYSTPKCSMCDNCLAEKKELVDITVPAQKFLSCVKRTGERFGAAHVIDVLKGSQVQKVFKFGHQDLSTYGIGTEYSKKQWLHLSRQLLHKGLMIQDTEFGSLKLTEKVWDVFKGKETVLGSLEEQQPAGNAPEQPEKNPACDRNLFEILRKKRKELADQASIPPYVIFSDKSLIEMAAFFPQTRESLLDIHGVGELKSEKYGAVFVKIIKEYCHTHNIESRPRRTRTQISGNDRSLRKKRHVVIGEAYNSGQSVSRIMTGFNIKQITVLDHLYKYLQEGNSLKPDEFLTLSTIPPDQKTAVLETFDRLGSELLRVVFDALNGDVDYEELKILRLCYLTGD